MPRCIARYAAITLLALFIAAPAVETGPALAQSGLGDQTLSAEMRDVVERLKKANGDVASLSGATRRCCS